MTIEIHRPELEALIQERMASGRFRSVEELLIKTLEGTSEAGSLASEPESLDAIFSPVRGLFADGELDFSRKPSERRAVDLL